MSENDRLLNESGSLVEKAKFVEIGLRIINDKYEVLFESVDQISNAKSLEDKYKREIMSLSVKLSINHDLLKEQMIENKKVMKLYDSQMAAFKSLLQTKRNLEKDKFYSLIRNASTLVSKER